MTDEHTHANPRGSIFVGEVQEMRYPRHIMCQQILRVFLSVGLGMLVSWLSAQQSMEAGVTLHSALMGVLRVVCNLLMATGKI